MYVGFGVKMMLSFGTKSAKGYYFSSSFLLFLLFFAVFLNHIVTRYSDYRRVLD
jgi:hypothetical protein